MENIVKIGPVELTETEVDNLYNAGRRYIVTSSRVYNIRWSQANRCYYYHMVYHKPYEGVWIERRGRFAALNAACVNKVIGHRIFAEP